MAEFRFAVVVATAPLSHEEILDATDALGEAGCLDASVRGHAQGMELLFDRAADSLQTAIGSAVRDVERAGFRVAVLSQPDWKTCEPWRQFGRPRLFFAVSAGNMDSLINHYTANKKVRNDDAYSPGGKIGLRPDRATLPYCQRAREAYPDARPVRQYV